MTEYEISGKLEAQNAMRKLEEIEMERVYTKIPEGNGAIIPYFITYKRKSEETAIILIGSTSSGIRIGASSPVEKIEIKCDEKTIERFKGELEKKLGVRLIEK